MIGRKRLFSKDMQKRIMVRLPDDTVEILTRIAAHEEVDVGTLVRRLLHRQMETLGWREAPPDPIKPQRKVHAA